MEKNSEEYIVASIIRVAVALNERKFRYASEHVFMPYPTELHM